MVGQAAMVIWVSPAGRSDGDTLSLNVFQGRERASARASSRARVFKKMI